MLTSVTVHEPQASPHIAKITESENTIVETAQVETGCLHPFM